MSIATTYFPFAGGLNLETPPLSTRPGELLDVNNYECLINGGYRRIAGYEPFDGGSGPLPYIASSVPGSGPVLGLHIYKGDVYAVRDSEGVGRMYKATSSGWAEVDPAVSWSGGGKYNFANFNFFGQDSQEEMFIANGIDRVKKFDGSSFVEINTGAVPDNPKRVIGYANFLFVAIESSLLHSELGDPTAWSAASGAGEIAVGDTINDLSSGPSALIVACEDSVKVIYGSTSMAGTADPFRLEELSRTGVYENTLKNISGTLIGLDRTGVMNLQATQAYGNFQYAALSMNVKRLMSFFDQNSVSCISRRSGQYRIFNEGIGLYFTFAGQNLAGITRVSFSHPVRCIANGFDANRKEVTYFGSDDGMVYEMDKGYRFAGEPISSYLVTSFHSFDGPTQRKRFRMVQPDIRVDGTGMPNIGVSVTTDYSKGLSSRGMTGGLSATGGALWDFSSWDDFKWDSFYHHDAKVRVSTTGTNMALLISSDGTEDALHSIYGTAVHYSTRRLIR